MNARTIENADFPFAESEPLGTEFEHHEATVSTHRHPSVWDRIDAAAERHRQDALASGAGDIGSAAYDPYVWEAVGRRVQSEARWLILTGVARAVSEAVRRLVTGRAR